MTHQNWLTALMAVIVTLLMVAALSGSRFYSDLQRDLADHQHYCDAYYAEETEGEEKEECKGVLYRAVADPAALATWVLTGVTTLLFVATAALFYGAMTQSRDAREAVAITRQTSEQQLRAYVVLKPFIHKPELNEVDGRVQSWSFRNVWHNVGSTPTKHMITRVGIIRVMSSEPLNFEDDIVEKVPGDPGRLFLGPGNEAASEKFVVSVEEMTMMMMECIQIYLWGCANYNDTFSGTARHRTEFCMKLVVAGDPKERSCRIGYQIYGPFNGTDDECYDEAEAYDPKLLS